MNGILKIHQNYMRMVDNHKQILTGEDVKKNYSLLHLLKINLNFVYFLMNPPIRYNAEYKFNYFYS